MEAFRLNEDSKNSIPIAYKETNPKEQIYISKNKPDSIGVTEMFTKEYLLPIPMDVDKRLIMFICAPSQAGKTTFITKFVPEFYKRSKSDNIVVFSDKEHDSLDNLNPYRIALNADLVEDEPDPLEFENSICIFDDIDGISEKDVKSVVFKLLDRMIKLGGEKRVHIIVTYHMMSNRNETRYLLFETHYIVMFPNTGSLNQTKNLFKNYVGLDNSQIKDIMNVDSRWCCVHKNHPRYLVHEHGAKIIT